MKKPAILKETATIKKENFVNGTYIMANEDLNDDHIGHNELKKYVANELGVSEVRIVCVDEEWVKTAIEATATE